MSAGQSKNETEQTGFPALVEHGSTERFSLYGIELFLVGRSQKANLPLLDIRCSRQQFQIVMRSKQYYVEPLSTNSPTYCNGTRLTGSQQLVHGDLIQAGASQFVFIEHDDISPCSMSKLMLVEQHDTQVPSQFAPDQRDRTILVGPDSKLESISLDHGISIEGNMLIGRDENRAAIYLPHTQVSRLHAQISLRNKLAIVSDLKSANGTYVNGTRITSAATLRPGDRIDIGPYALVFNGRSLLPQSRVNNVELACRNLTRTVKSSDYGRPVTILDDVSLVIRPREFVCLLGPSGSGKSTLLTALSARIPAQQGKVTINGEDLYNNFEALKRDIAMVPQKDALHEFLDVRTALKNTARLRLPPDTTDLEVNELVVDMINTVGLTSRVKTQIRNLSGGQLKRASLANEIVSQPSLLFLDEVTSGLDEQTDREMMKLFRSIADGGKTVVCVTHSLAYIEEFCHRVVILAEGGKLAFVGTPTEATKYFGVDRLGEIYEKLRKRPAEDWKTDFLKDSAYKRHVLDYLDADSSVEFAVIERNPTSITDRWGLYVRQTQILTLRYLKIQIADMRSLLMMMGQCLLVGFMIVLLFGNIGNESSPDDAFMTSKVMFLLAISGFWFGCNNAAKEIVKERTIYTRERDVNLLVSSYLSSKVILLGAMCLFQTALLVGIVKLGTSVDCGLGQFILLATISIAGVGLGLLISAFSQSTDMAVTIVPLVLIPQIIFSGAIANVEGLAWLVAVLSIITYWGYGGLIACLPTEMVDVLNYEEWAFLGAWFVLLLHTAVYVGAAFLVLQCDNRDPVYGKALEKLVSKVKKNVLANTLDRF